MPIFIMRFLFIFLSIWGIFSSMLLAQERQIQCKVVGISDGDTLTCLQDRKPIKVRLLHIDAPESAQPFGKKAKQALSELAFKKEVVLQATGYDKYHRVLAVVFDGNRNVNLALVEKGMAWAYHKTQAIYEKTMADAKASRIGLWQDSHPINPADWRKAKKEQQTEAHKRSDSRDFLPRVLKDSSLSGLRCDEKLSCKKIGDYELAKRYYQQCGWKHLDGNHDGIVCNKLYRKSQR